MRTFSGSLIAMLLCTTAAQAAPALPGGTPDAQAAALEAKMTDAERVRLLYSDFARPDRTGEPLAPGAVGSASFTPGIQRLGIPALQETDASLGVAWVDDFRKDGATALPSGMSLAASWNPDVAYRGSAMIAQESRAKGFNVLLAGGVNLTREPRNGRNFEYLGEDPLLAGTLAGETIRAIQDSHMISTIKHFAVNPQETGRHVVNSVIAEPAARDSDLLAFRIAMDRGKPGAVMCSYNRYNGPHACQSDFLLNQVLKTDWHYPGFVMSDWGAVRSVDDLRTGLDRESGDHYDARPYFRQDLAKAIAADPALKLRVRDASRRILRSMIASGLFDHPPQIQPIDVAADAAISQNGAAAGIVLLKNEGVLPLAKRAQRIAVIGGYANLGVMSGGGSSQVAPQGGPALRMTVEGAREMMLQPSPPLAAIKARLSPDSSVTFDAGWSPSAAAAAAKNADIAIVFATQWTTESLDAGDLNLPQGQDAVIAAVAQANPRTIVVLETGGPVLMPWLDKVAAVAEAWYPGARGGEAIAGMLVGDTSPTGRLPITFPKALDELPRPLVDDTPDPAREPGSQSHDLKPFDVNYNIEGSDVGYRWFDRKQIKPLFPFGFGLSYTRFAYSDLHIKGGKTLTIDFSVKNTGERAGSDVPQLYVTDRAGTPGKRLIGWSNVTLAPGEVKHVTVAVDPRLLADWSAAEKGWKVQPGAYRVALGASSDDAQLAASASVTGSVLR